MLQNLPAMQETQLRSLGQEDPLEKGMSTHSRILAWRTPFAEDPGGLQSMGLPKLDMTEQLSHTHTHTQISDREMVHLREMNSQQAYQKMLNVISHQGSQNTKPCTLMLTYYGLCNFCKVCI